MRDCAVFVPVMSRYSRDADWVAKEILLALQLRKPILMREAQFLLVGQGTSEIQKTIFSRGLLMRYRLG